jgi:CO/xanthine dehydrogenase Mo-binding subunit
VPYAYGPAGAKGIGELPMDGPAPAIVNAIAQAIDRREAPELDRLPVMPEDLLSAVEEARS